MTTIGLVACAKTKRPGRHPARELYASPLFQKALAHCERAYDHTFILSALHRAVPPDQELSWYNVCLANIKDRTIRRAWAQDTYWRIYRLCKDRGIASFDDVPVYFHAGLDYREFLLAYFPRAECPLVGLGVGEQLRWYNEHARAN
jgi:hypothetical protein